MVLYHLFGTPLGDDQDTVLGLAVIGGHALLVDFLVALVMLVQVQRHARRGEPRNPWKMIVIFAVLDVGLRHGWGRLVGFVSAHLPGTLPGFYPAVLRMFSEGVLAPVVLMILTLLSALIAVRASGRVVTGPPAPVAGDRAARCVQALTLCCSLNFVVSLFSSIGAASVVRTGIESMFLYQVLTRVIPLAMSLLLGFAIYVCWPRRLQQASGWALFLLGWIPGFVAVLPAFLVYVLSLLMGGGVMAWLGYGVWPVYAVAAALVAAIVGGFGRGRGVA